MDKGNNEVSISEFKIAFILYVVMLSVYLNMSSAHVEEKPIIVVAEQLDVKSKPRSKNSGFVLEGHAQEFVATAIPPVWANKQI